MTEMAKGPTKPSGPSIFDESFIAAIFHYFTSRTNEDWESFVSMVLGEDDRRMNMRTATAVPHIPEMGKSRTTNVRRFSELHQSGILWLVNRVVFHPRGWALGLQYDDALEPVGWVLLGNGLEPWVFADDHPLTENELFRRVQTLLSPIT